MEIILTILKFAILAWQLPFFSHFQAFTGNSYLDGTNFDVIIIFTIVNINRVCWNREVFISKLQQLFMLRAT